MSDTSSTVGPQCPYCEYRYVETTAWGAGDYEQTCRRCGKRFDLTIRVTRTYIGRKQESSHGQ